VLECIPQTLARKVSGRLGIPTIGIGAGAGCDGQVLVLHDLLGFDPKFQPRFVRRFADGAELVNVGVGKYADAVRAGKFPNTKESF
jgi:3-methyl-2-oxobutanoate hydroxymethyltransferase